MGCGGSMIFAIKRNKEEGNTDSYQFTQNISQIHNPSTLHFRNPNRQSSDCDYAYNASHTNFFLEINK